MCSLIVLKLWKVKAKVYATYDALLWVACKMRSKITADIIIEIIKTKAINIGKKFKKKIFF